MVAHGAGCEAVADGGAVDGRSAGGRWGPRPGRPLRPFPHCSRRIRVSTIVIGAGPGGLAAAAALKLRGEEVVALERAHSVGSTCARVDLSQRVGVRRKTCPGGGNGQHWRRDRHRPA
ncbi:hypothetical protein CGZ93_00735 [Enemella dayhoffiae]|uniref:Uncharacterized protein n=1 Tax=Enemella dayhoffiae TaxID=2016507 RepID=A0A255HFU5_9ACTN|nr:hypothetical protein CGZ93_00735 [Enemella dayhoffiae]